MLFQPLGLTHRPFSGSCTHGGDHRQRALTDALAKALPTRNLATSRCGIEPHRIGVAEQHGRQYPKVGLIGGIQFAVVQAGLDGREGEGLAARHVSFRLADVPASATFGVFAIPTRRKTSAATPPSTNGPAQ